MSIAVVASHEVIAAVPTAYADAVLADTPLGYWRLGAADGVSTMADSSGNAHPGTFAGPFTHVTGLLSGDADTAVSFNGTSASGQVADGAWMRPYTVMTAECLFSATSLPAGGHTLVARNAQSAAVFYLRTEGSKLAGAVVPSTGGFKSVAGSTTLVTGQKYHAALTYDGSTVRLYLNGVQDGSFTFAGTLVQTTGVQLSIGANALTTPSEYFAGVIDEVALYRTALSSRIAAHAALV